MKHCAAGLVLFATLLAHVTAMPGISLQDAPASEKNIVTPTNSTNHLYFYWKNAAYARCGDVDAAPRMPDALFEPENKAALQAYIKVTIDLYHITDGNPSDKQKVQLKQGTCKENGFGTLLPGCPQRHPNCSNPNPITAEWAPKKMMKVICGTACNCNYPGCPDVPDDPKTMHWCSLCGPKYNAPIKVTLYNPSPSHATAMPGISLQDAPASEKNIVDI